MEILEGKLKPNQSIYFDTNIFRPIIRELKNWERFEDYCDREIPDLLDSSIIFTWSQLLEMIDKGSVMTEIKKSLIWKNSIEGRNLLDRFSPHIALDKQFDSAVNALENLSLLQKDSLLKGIDNAVSRSCPEAKLLIDNTFLRYRACVSSNNYMEQLSREIAWAFLASQSFVMSFKQWDHRKQYYDSLMALWHKLHLEGHNLCFFRLSEMQYYSFLKYSPELDLDEALNLYPQAKNREELVDLIFKFPPLKSEGDLCDGEIVSFTRLGSSIKKGEAKSRVIGITRDDRYKMDQRAGVFDRSLLDLERCVEGWNVKSCAGEIFSFSVDTEGNVQSSHRLLLRK